VVSRRGRDDRQGTDRHPRDDGPGTDTVGLGRYRNRGEESGCRPCRDRRSPGVAIRGRGAAEAGDTGPENILRALDWLRETNGGRHADRVLVLTTDLPLVRSESIVGFVDACPAEVDLCLPLVARSEFEARFPGLRNEFVRLRDGRGRWAARSW